MFWDVRIAFDAFEDIGDMTDISRAVTEMQEADFPDKDDERLWCPLGPVTRCWPCLPFSVNPFAILQQCQTWTRGTLGKRYILFGRGAPHTFESHHVIYGQRSGLTESKVQNMQRRRGSSLNVNTGSSWKTHLSFLSQKRLSLSDLLRPAWWRHKK